MIRLREFFDDNENSPYRRWFDALDVAAATGVTVALERLAGGHRSSLKSVGEGVFECKIEFGPGYRIYFGYDGEELVILLGGGSKKRQSRDIAEAQAAWSSYKLRKKELERIAEAERRRRAKTLTQGKPNRR